MYNVGISAKQSIFGMAFPVKIFILAAGIHITVAVVCDSGWNPAGDSCFFISENRMKYFQAKDKCASIGGRIATFYENEFNDLKKHIGSGDYWVGLEFQGEPGSEIWRWNDNTPTGDWVDSNWGYGEPDLGEYYTRVTDTKKFAGLYSSYDIGYICKKGVLPSTTTSTSTTTTTTTTVTTPTTTTTTSPTPRAPTTASPTTQMITTPTTSTISGPGGDHASASSTNTPITSQSTIQSTLETTPHGKPHEGRSETSRSTTAGTPLIESGLVDKPEKNLAIWISMGVVGICGSVAMVIGIVCCIRARQPKQKSPEEGDPHYTDLDKTGKDNPEYADLSNANTLSNGKTQNIIYYEDSVLNSVKTEDGADVYEEIRDSKVPEVKKAAEANLDDPKVDEYEIDTTTAVTPPPYDSVCVSENTEVYDYAYADIGDSKVPEVEKSAEANLDDPKVDECGIDVTTSVAPPPYDSVCGNHSVA